ncbi:hypothetical protein NESM_000852100 [Novymonas esmeraldas]|uniref:Uncharacterized protein n=1 Tax=Novymonas esmeraldas TaxID=1808958 RepID=A0AAW0EX43_9TRYP
MKGSEAATGDVAAASAQTWCNGVRQLTSEYFDALGGLVTAARLGGGGHCGASATQLRAAAGMRRNEYEDDAKLDVHATDIEAMEMALLQQLWMHQQQQRPAKGMQAPGAGAGDDAGRNAHDSAVAAVSSADPPTPAAPLSTPTSAADVAAAGATPNTDWHSYFLSPRHPSPAAVAAAASAQVPAELLAVFRAAQSRQRATDAAATGLTEDEGAEAAALAYLCYRYFFTPTAATTPASAPPARSPHAFSRTEALSSPTALGSPAAWRALIAKYSAADLAAGQQQQQQPSSTPATSHQQQRHRIAQSPLAGDILIGVPPPRVLVAAVDTTAAADAGTEARTVARGTAGRQQHRHGAGASGGSRTGTPSAPPPRQPRPTQAATPHTTASHAANRLRGEKNQRIAKLPPLDLHATAATPAAAAAAAVATPRASDPSQRVTLPAVAAGVAPSIPPVTATAAPAAQATSPPAQHDGVSNAKRRICSAHRRHVARHLPRTVVLPPNYSGVHGEHLTMAQLQQLLASVTQDGVTALADGQRHDSAADAAAAELYRLQQAVARVLLANVQLEKDINTLTAAAAVAEEAEANDADDADDVDQSVSNRGRRRGRGAQGKTGANTTASASAPYMAAPLLTATAAALALPERRRRQLLLPPAPMPVPLAKSTLTAPSLLLRSTSTKPSTAAVVAPAIPRPWRQESALAEGTTPSHKSVRKNRPRVAVPATAAEPQQQQQQPQHPRLVLHELQAAIASREAEHAQTLVEIDALSKRVHRHDTLLHAVAEYWRRNAAVMKRQHFAVRSLPRRSTPSETATHPSDGAGGVADVSTSPYLHTASGGTRDPTTTTTTGTGVARGRSGSAHSASSRKDSQSPPVTATTSLSGRMTTLDGSPSQLQRALAHMEAVSDTPPSSSLSFDPHTASSMADTRLSLLPMEVVLRRQIVPTRRKEQQQQQQQSQDAGDGGAAITAVAGGSASERMRAAVHVTPAMDSDRGGRQHRKVVPLYKDNLSSAAVVSGTGSPHTNKVTTTAATSPGSADADAVGQQLSIGIVERPASAAGAVGATSRRGHTAPAVAGASVCTNSTSSGSPGTLSTSSPGFPRPHESPTSREVYSASETTHDKGGSTGSSSSSTSNSPTSTPRFPTTSVTVHRAPPPQVPVTTPSSPAAAATAATAANSPLNPSRGSTANHSHHLTSSSTRREDEDVLERGSWRTIPALQLEDLDEIAEFIYSVFERV